MDCDFVSGTNADMCSVRALTYAYQPWSIVSTAIPAACVCPLPAVGIACRHARFVGVVVRLIQQRFQPVKGKQNPIAGHLPAQIDDLVLHVLRQVEKFEMRHESSIAA